MSVYHRSRLELVMCSENGRSQPIDTMQLDLLSNVHESQSKQAQYYIHEGGR